MPGPNKPTFEVGNLTVAVAGVAEQLTAHRIPNEGFYLVVHARSTNTGVIYFGKTKAIAEEHLVTLEAGASAMLSIDNVGDVWVDVSVQGDIVEWWHETHNVDV